MGITVRMLGLPPQDSPRTVSHANEAVQVRDRLELLFAIYYCGQESLRRNGVAMMVNKRV